MLISDWSSDVCSSVLIDPGGDRIDIKVTRDRHHVHGGEFAQYRLLSERRGEGPLSFWRRLRPVVYLKAAIGEDDAPSGPPDTRQTAATRRLPFVERESEVDPLGAMPFPHRGGRQDRKSTRLYSSH